MSLCWTILHYSLVLIFVLEDCALTNNETTWRVLSKISLWLQGPDPRPLRVLVGIPRYYGPKLAHCWAEHSRVLQTSHNMHLFDTKYLYTIVCVITLMTSPSEVIFGFCSQCGGLFTHFKLWLFDHTAVARSWKVTYGHLLIGYQLS